KKDGISFLAQLGELIQGIVILCIMCFRQFVVAFLLLSLTAVVLCLRSTEERAVYASSIKRPRQAAGLRKGSRTSFQPSTIVKNLRRSQIRRNSNEVGLKSLFFFCTTECGKGQYCSKLGFCRPLKFDGVTCKKEEQCLSGICLDSECKACNVDDDCPSKGKRMHRLDDEQKKYCQENTCVACVQDDHCETGQVCASDNTCKECDSDDDCSEDNVCSKTGAENRCAQCYNDDHCQDGQRCSYGHCVECLEDIDCASGRCQSTRCEAPVCKGSCTSNSGCISGVCYIRTSFFRGSRTRLFGHCEPCEME
ncbi:unnamed protein product, partial [Owenia fusiformis]